MENSKMVVDTTIFIEHLHAKNKIQTTLSRIPDKSEIFISSLTIYELLTLNTKDFKKNQRGHCNLWKLLA